MDIFDLSATLSLDSSKYDGGLENAKSKGASFASNIGGAFKKVAAGAAIVTGAVTAIGAGFANAAKKTADYGDKVDKMSQKIGISAEAYQKWDYVMQRAGGSIDSMKMGMKTLSKQAQENNEDFQKLGISQEEVKNLSQEDLFERTVKGLASMEQSTERATLASELLGRAGADMGPLLNGGTEAIEEQMEIAEKYGMVMPDSAVKASAAFEDSLTTMSMTFDGLKNRMMAEFLPAMTQVTDGLAKLFAGDMSGAEDVSKGIDQFIQKMGEILPVIMEIGGKIVGNLAQSFVDNLPTILASVGEFMMNVVNKIGEWVSKIPEMMANSDLAGGIESAIQQFFDKLPEMLEGFATFIEQIADWMVENGPSIIIALAKGFIKALPKIVAVMGRIINAILKVIVGLPVKLLAMGLSAVGKFALGLLKGVNSATKAIGKIIKSIVDAAGDKIKDFLNVGKNIVEGIWKGISGGYKWIKDKISGWVGNVVDFIKKVLGISSPSKVMAQEVGKWIPAGIAKGILANSAMVDDAMEDIIPTEIGDISSGVTMTKTNGSGKGITNKDVVINAPVTVNGSENAEEFAERFARQLKMSVRTA